MENSREDTETKSRNKNLKKGKQPTIQNKPDAPRVKTVAPDNDSGEPGPPAEKSSNVGQGPAVENL
ncbi:MAG: hypothetical protein JWQ63_3964 [Mucilaginibacter sp.]|jgi:hypothetical protein|nr:hypothetical protein [Mucilaginibacter sp.]